ncbi:hypothetical protein B0H13DRAFT_1852907 [Mycena leptocephala]|nr:hypothetical protein B0H13DRAFT_1852907 [Mycena leptocephala]
MSPLVPPSANLEATKTVVRYLRDGKNSIPSFPASMQEIISSMQTPNANDIPPNPLERAKVSCGNDVREAISSRLNWNNDDFESGDLVYYMIYALNYTYGSSGPDAIDVWANAPFSPLAKIPGWEIPSACGCVSVSAGPSGEWAKQLGYFGSPSDDVLISHWGYVYMTDFLRRQREEGQQPMRIKQTGILRPFANLQIWHTVLRLVTDRLQQRTSDSFIDTVAKAFVANSFFAAIMVRTGAYKAQISSLSELKMVADAFEAYVESYRTEMGPAKLESRVRRNFEPLADAVQETLVSIYNSKFSVIEPMKPLHDRPRGHSVAL